MPILSASLCAAVLGLSASAASARTYNVTRTDDPNNSMCAAPYVDCTLREALNTINANPDPPDVVNLAAGDYGDGQVLPFATTTSVSIVGPGSAQATIHGAPGVSVFNMSGTGTPSPTVSISGVTITGGSPNGPGGAINTGVTVHLDRVAIVGNSATFGGAIRTHAAPLTISRSLIAGNSASQQGGGVVAGDAVTITDSTISGNTAGNGSAAAQGGGIALTDLNGALVVGSSTIADNTVSGPGSEGGNIAVTANSPPHMTFAYSIIADGHGPSANCWLDGATPTSFGYNIEDADQCGLNGTGDKHGVDPMLGPLSASPTASDTLALLPGSPAINNGVTGTCTDPAGDIIATDQRGIVRPQGVACDSGAFEFRLPVITGAPSLSGTATVGNTLTCTAASASSPDGGPVTTAFAWLRDGSQISGASAATYQLAAADSGHQVACKQTATNAAGPVSATSSAVSVPVPPPPPPPVPPKLTFSAKTVTINGHGTGSLGATCDAPSGDACTVTGTLYGAGRLPASAASLHKRAAKLGTVKGTIVAGARGKLTVRLTKAGKALLSTHARLRVRVVGTVSDQAGASSTLREKLTLRRKRRA
jgi:hypothetical protein